MKGSGFVVAAALSGLAVAMAGSSAGAATVARVAQSNSASFTYPALVGGSSTVITRGPAAAVVVTLSARPQGRMAVVTAVVANRGAAAVTFPAGGVRVAARVARDGRTAGTWVLRSPATSALAPGRSVTVTRSFLIPRQGTYEVTGFVRYSG